MEFQANAKVTTADGRDFGQLDRIVLNPRTKEISYIVVRKGLLQKDERVLPMDLVESNMEDRVILRKDADPLESYPKFDGTAYIQIPDQDVEGPEHFSGSPEPRINYPSSVYPYYPIGTQTMQYIGSTVTASKNDQRVDDVQGARNIPSGSVALKENARVISEEGDHVGNIERIFLEQSGGNVTHFLISKGALFPQEKVIPASWVDRIEDDMVVLSVSTRVLEKVPDHREPDNPGGSV